MQGGSDARREPRFAVNQPVEVKIDGPSQLRSGTGAIIDISEHGLSFTFRRPLQAGDSVTIEYEGCLLLGEVRHCRAREYANQRQYLIGLAVTRVVQGEQIWRRLMQQCCSGA